MVFSMAVPVSESGTFLYSGSRYSVRLLCSGKNVKSVWLLREGCELQIVVCRFVGLLPSLHAAVLSSF